MIDPDDLPVEEVAQGVSDFVNYLEECSDQECLYTYEALMRGSLLLYDFRDKGSRSSSGIETD